MIMKLFFILSSTILMTGKTAIARFSGQTLVVFGRLTNEVLESVGASLNAISRFNMKNNHISAVSTSKKGCIIHTEPVKLAAITINSGTSVAFNLLIHSAKLADYNGDGFTIDPGMLIRSHDYRWLDCCNIIKQCNIISQGVIPNKGCKCFCLN